MNKFNQIIKEYEAEYERVNGRKPRIYVKRAWVEIELNFYRKSEVAAMLVAMKARKSFYP